jgi:hypothetical protein
MKRALLKLWPIQMMIYNEIQRKRREGKPIRLLILKGRQVGTSTLVAAYQFTKSILHPLTNCLVVAHDKPASQNLYNMSTFFYDNLHPSVRPMRRYYNANKLVFENPDEKNRHTQPGLGSRIIVDTASKINIGRSFTFQSVHMSEFAFWKDPGETYDAIMSAVPPEPETFVAVESTPNGAGGDFYELWRDATLNRDESSWIPVFAPFWLDPTYTINLSDKKAREIMHTLDMDEERYVNRFKLTPGQIAWRRWAIQERCRGSVEKFNQEYAPTAEECFLIQGSSVFAKEALSYYMKMTRPGKRGRLKDLGTKVVFNEDGTGPLTIWEAPKPGAQYSIGVDSAWGLEDRDYSAMCVLKAAKKPVQVAEFHARIAPPVFAEQAMLLGKFYNTALLMPETTGMGSSLIFNLREDYPRLGMWERLQTSGRKQSDSVGWDMNRRSKSVLRGEMTSRVYERMVTINSEHLVREMSTYVYKKDLDTMEAGPGSNDDLVIAFGLALMGLKQIPLSNLDITFAPEDSPITNIWTPAGVTGVFTPHSTRDHDEWMML